jgi:hypothetical protein
MNTNSRISLADLKDIREQILFNRGVEAAIWGLPGVNFMLMFEEMKRLGGDFNQIVYWPGLLDWKNQTLTPNPDVIYLMPFFNTKDVGPVVLDVPPADDGVLNGSVMNYWQAAIEDIGPGGVDKGKGGKYAFLPPGYDPSQLPAEYIPMPSDTFMGYALIRVVLKSTSDEDIAKAVEYGKRIQVYPLSQAGSVAPTKYIDASNEVFDSTIQYDIRLYQTLDKIIQAEPWLERDKAMIDPLKTIGIERGEKFNPDARTAEILSSAVVAAREWLESLYHDFPGYYEGKQWFFPATEENHQSIIHNFHVPDSYPIDNRAMCYMMAFFSARHIGESQYYLMVTRDKNGNQFEGNAHYKVTVPAGVPVKQYWSMTVYDRETHALVRNLSRPGRSSQSQGLQTNGDGSVDLYFGPTAPASGDSNWTPTDPNRQFEILARFYGPQKSLYDKSWQLNDVERVG